MSISPPPSSSNLFYISIDRVASPKPINTNPDSSSEPKGYQFGDTERINPLHFQPVKLEDGEVSNDSQSLLPPAPFTPARPAQIQVKVRNFEEAHNLREAEAKTNAPSSVPNLESPPRLQSDTRRNLDFLYHTLHYVYGQIRQQNPQINDDAATDWNSNDEEEEDDNDDDKDWRTPASTGPPQGNSTHPPSQWVCGEHPGIGWELNDPLTTNFYRVTIPDPTTSRLVVAPFVTYAIQRDRAEISATYGKGYPIHRSFTSRLFTDCSVSCTGLLLIPPCVRFLFPSAFLIDVLLCAYRAQSLLVSDCTIYRDYPLSCFISETLSLTEDTPHHLIIALPSSTLRVFPLRHVFVTRHTVRPPPTIQCPPSLRHLIRRF
jgi:hypothetical protein